MTSSATGCALARRAGADYLRRPLRSRYADVCTEQCADLHVRGT